MGSAKASTPDRAEFGHLDVAVDDHLRRDRKGPQAFGAPHAVPGPVLADDETPPWAIELRDAVRYLAERIGVLERALAEAVLGADVAPASNGAVLPARPATRKPSPGVRGAFLPDDDMWP